MKDIEGTAYTLIAYSKALKCKVRLVIWQMPNGKKKLIPYRARNINIVSIAIDAPQDVISALSGKIGNLDGISVKTAYSNVQSDE